MIVGIINYILCDLLFNYLIRYLEVKFYNYVLVLFCVCVCKIFWIDLKYVLCCGNVGKFMYKNYWV